MNDEATIRLNDKQCSIVNDALARAAERYREAGRDDDADRAWQTREAVKAAQDAFGRMVVATDRTRALEMHTDVLKGALKAESDGYSATAERMKRTADDAINPVTE